MFASQSGHMEIAKLLLDSNAVVDHENKVSAMRVGGVGSGRSCGRVWWLKMYRYVFIVVLEVCVSVVVLGVGSR